MCEDRIRVLQHQNQEQAAILESYQQPYPIKPQRPAQWEDNSVPPRPSSRISNGQATGLRKEAAFLRERLVSGNLSSEDREKAIEVLHLIEGGKSEPSTITTVKDKGIKTKSTTFNVSSNGHDNGSATLALDLKMHDLTKSITKMRAFDKCQRMQQDTDRLARIEEKLSKPKDSKSKDKTNESDRVSAFQKRTAREVENLNKRFDELLAKDTGTSDRALKQEIEDLKANMSDMNYRYESDVDGIAILDDKVQQVLDGLDRNKGNIKVESSKATETSRPASAASHAFGSAYPNKPPPPPPEAKVVSCLHCGGQYNDNFNCGKCPWCGLNNSVAKEDPWAPLPNNNDYRFKSFNNVVPKHDAWVPFNSNDSRYADSRDKDDGEWDRKCKEWAEERKRKDTAADPGNYGWTQYSAAPSQTSKRSAGQRQYGLGGWSDYSGCVDNDGGCGPCHVDHPPSELSSGWSMPGKVATVTSSVNEDCGPIQTFRKKKSSTSGIDTPGSSWDSCGSGSQTTYTADTATKSKKGSEERGDRCL